MILEPNVPKYARNWATCQVMLARTERALMSLRVGKPTTLSESWFIKFKGREKFIEEVARPAIPRLERGCRHYRALIRALTTHGSPLQYLFSRREMLELIGVTLHYTDRRSNEIYRTLLYCSPDGKRLFCDLDNGESNGIDALDLLSFGFGRA